VDGNGVPKKIYLEIGVTAEFVVANARLFYRTSPEANYKQVKLRRNASLNYDAFVPSADKLEFYLGLKPERGPEVFVRSQEGRFLLESSRLEKVKGAKTEKAKTIAVAAVAIILAIIGAGIAKSHAR
jgi:hypothetical protein